MFLIIKRKKKIKVLKLTFSEDYIAHFIRLPVLNSISTIVLLEDSANVVSCTDSQQMSSYAPIRLPHLNIKLNHLLHHKLLLLTRSTHQLSLIAFALPDYQVSVFSTRSEPIRNTNVDAERRSLNVSYVSAVSLLYFLNFYEVDWIDFLALPEADLVVISTGKYLWSFACIWVSGYCLDSVFVGREAFNFSNIVVFSDQNNNASICACTRQNQPKLIRRPGHLNHHR